MAEPTIPASRPCGHCGGTDVFVEREDLCAYQARCDGCGARGPIVEHGDYITDDGRGQEAARAAWNQRFQPPAEALIYPDVMTPALHDALGVMNFQSGPVAHALRAGGADIKRRCEDEQAHVLHWFIQLALRHDEGWRKVVGDEMKRLANAARKG
ncbi:hypothetical protein J2847_006449 [Azospirillum agricola]|uniref:Lar family restriction alleviation protein n=1 Tax=Azospirillum agricola TaxID=1720247 RepID=UPI001AE4493F|nr:Lar family restriction alleviation protein [Azospirillum agricola]MBP2233114.1 hypothetical protein [Azospirillum agricola]